VEFVGCGWGWEGVGEFGWVDGDGAVEAFAGDVAGVEEAAGKISDGEVVQEMSSMKAPRPGGI
jgi:hypothetical protein